MFYDLQPFECSNPDYFALLPPAEKNSITSNAPTFCGLMADHSIYGD